jgi:hypothetical protein
MKNCGKVMEEGKFLDMDTKEDYDKVLKKIGS